MVVLLTSWLVLFDIVNRTKGIAYAYLAFKSGKGYAMQTVIHTSRRGYYSAYYYSYVQDDGPDFGRSARIAYAMGLDGSNHLLPATIIEKHCDSYTYAMFLLTKYS